MATPDQDMEGLLADAGDASVLVHDGGLFTTRPHHSARGEQEDEQAKGKNKK